MLRDPRIEYTRGVALYRLGRTEAATSAWRRAASAKPPLVMPAEVRQLLQRDRPVTEWASYWFSAGPGRWLLGALLLLSLGFVLATEFVAPGEVGGLKTGQGWQVIVPVVVLAVLILLPMLARFSLRSPWLSIDLEPRAVTQGFITDELTALPPRLSPDVSFPPLLRPRN